MKAASLKELKAALENLDQEEVLNICVRLAKYKKDNKELLTYLLFDAMDEQAYIRDVQKLLDEQFADMNKSNIYFSKKTIRKALRTANRFIRYSGNAETEVQLLIYYCNKIKDSGIDFRKSTAMSNLFQRQLERINKALSTLHEDLQYDYSKEIGLL